MAHLLGYSIFIDKGNRCYPHWMTNLEDVATVSNVDWSTAALTTFLKYMRVASRGNGDNYPTVTLQSFWKVLEVILASLFCLRIEMF